MDSAYKLKPANEQSLIRPRSHQNRNTAVIVPKDARWKVAIVGAGNIAETHASVLSALPDVEITAIVDLDLKRATAFAERWKAPDVLNTTEALISAHPKTVDVAHVLVPPQLHMPVAKQLLTAGIHVFIEKPLGQSLEECNAIAAAAELGQSRFEVNHNFTYHPAHREALRLVRDGKLGRLRHVTMNFHMPLHQLASRQLGHWMFDRPRNLLLEQAIHPLSLIDHLIGSVSEADCVPASPEKIAGNELIRSFLLTLRSKSATAQLHFSVGESYPVWRALLICDDGAISVDYLTNRVTTEETRRWLPAFGNLQNGLTEAGSILCQECTSIVKYVTSTLKLRSRNDSFFVSMRDSIRSFYTLLRDPRATFPNGQGARLVSLCSDLATRVERPNSMRVPSLRTRKPRLACDVAVIGGTGFIGQHLVAALLRKNKAVAVIARNVRRLPPVFEEPRLTLVQGDATKYEDIRAAIGEARVVVNLAQGGGSTPAEFCRNLVGSAGTVAKACIDAQTERLVYVSSIAALYLGDRRSIVTGVTPPDPRADLREPYSRAKAEAERHLLDLYRERSLPVCILRPGVVIGEGGLPFHLGVGLFTSERHCMGWNRGGNALPFVLATDVADAIVRSLAAPDISGRCYNLVGGVSMSAREYVDELARALGRPLQFHPQSVYKLFVVETVKHLIKRLIGRGDPRPTLHDLLSRGLVARFDCSDATRDLGWHPVVDRAEFLRAGIQIYGSPH